MLHASQSIQPAGVEGGGHIEKKRFIELEGRWVLLKDLPDAIQKLKKDWTPLRIGRAAAVTHTIGELVSRNDPLLMWKVRIHGKAIRRVR